MLERIAVGTDITGVLPTMGIWPVDFNRALKSPVPLEEITFDFTGSSAQRRGPLNAPRSALLSAVKTVFRALVDPQAPSNEGWFRPLHIVVPDGTVFSAQYPSPVGWYYEIGRGLPAPDLVRAYTWYGLSAIGGDPDAAISQEEVIKKMTPEQIEKAHILINDYKSWIYPFR